MAPKHMQRGSDMVPKGEKWGNLIGLGVPRQTVKRST